MRQARLAGFTGVPDLVGGAQARLEWPASGKVEDIKAGTSPGSDLIVAAARKATPEKPLLVVVGGPLTTVAQAWLTDPTIASRMVVAGIFSYSMQNHDSAANYLVARKCRFVHWGRTYTWLGAHDTSLVAKVPLSRMGERTRQFLLGSATRLPLGDLSPVAYLFRRGLWKSADMVKVSRAIEVRPASDINFDFLDIPAAANDWQGYQDEFYATLADMRAYHPIALPGRVEAEAFVGMNGIGGVGNMIVDSATGNEAANCSIGDWLDYRIEPAAAGDFKATARYRSGGGAKLLFSLGAQPAFAELVLPASVDWAEAVLPVLPLATGPQTLRVTVTGGETNLDWLELRP